MDLLMAGHAAERLDFRMIKATDFDDWLPFFVDPRTSQYWVMEQLPAAQACAHWYARQSERLRDQRGGMNALIERQTGALVGHCGLLIQMVEDQAEVEIGYALLPAFWGRGFASEAARASRDFAFQNHLAESLISIISCTNVPSQQVAKANGMQVEKTISWSGNQVDIYRINRGDWLRNSKPCSV